MVKNRKEKKLFCYKVPVSIDIEPIEEYPKVNKIEKIIELRYYIDHYTQSFKLLCNNLKNSKKQKTNLEQQTLNLENILKEDKEQHRQANGNLQKSIDEIQLLKNDIDDCNWYYNNMCYPKQDYINQDSIEERKEIIKNQAQYRSIKY